MYSADYNEVIFLETGMLRQKHKEKWFLKSFTMLDLILRKQQMKQVMRFDEYKYSEL